ncbi:hypothetical protein GQ457_08G026350 [Hibiscus cannabinus]
MLSARPQGNLSSNTEVSRGMGQEQCKMVTTRSRTTKSNDSIQVEENEQLSIEENESPEIATTIPHATSTKGIYYQKMSKGKEIQLPPSFPQRLRKQKYEYQFRKFLDILKQKGQLTMRVNEQQVTLNVFKALKRSDNPEECHNVNAIDAEI